MRSTAALISTFRTVEPGSCPGIGIPKHGIVQFMRPGRRASPSKRVTPACRHHDKTRLDLEAGGLRLARPKGLRRARKASVPPPIGASAGERLTTVLLDGLRGEVSNPVPLPPPASRPPPVLCAKSWQLRPTLAAISNLGFGLPKGRSGPFFSEWPILSRALDSADPIRFSNSNVSSALSILMKWVLQSLSVGEGLRIQNRHGVIQAADRWD